MSTDRKDFTVIKSMTVKADSREEANETVILRLNRWFQETTNKTDPPYPPGTLLHFGDAEVQVPPTMALANIATLERARTAVQHMIAIAKMLGMTSEEADALPDVPLQRTLEELDASILLYRPETSPDEAA